MAKDKLTEYDATANNNTVCGDVNIAENSALPSDMNNFAREIMSHLKEFSAGTSGVDVLSFQDDDNSHQLKFQAPSTVSTTTTFTLPNGDGSSGQFLKTDGSGTLSFATATGTTINNNADNRIITGSGTSNTLEGESTLTYDGTNLSLGDSKKLRFGASQDLEIYHDESNSYVKDAGTGSLIIEGANVQIQDTQQDLLAKFNNAGAVQLYHVDSGTSNVKLATSGAGVSVTGTVTATAFSGDGSALTGVSGSNAVNTVGTYAFLYRNSTGTTNAGGTSSSGTLYFSGAGGGANQGGVAGTWRCMGKQQGYTAGTEHATTLWIRIS